VPERSRLRVLAAAYFGGHAVLDLMWWLTVSNVARIRGWFELDATNRRVLDSFLLGDLLLLGVVSFAAAVALLREWRAATALAGVVTGASAYATLYLAGWVLRGGHGWMGVAAMTIETALMAVFIALLLKARPPTDADGHTPAG
jgi:hypothetical protein